MPNTWFASWFDTPYYHILYQNRSHAEAQSFIELLHAYLRLVPQVHVLDLACGKGRHSRTLHQLGYHVIGIDLSAQSIASANEYAKPNLEFFVHDMRTAMPQKFGAIFNLFTSFGYFDTTHDDQKILDSAHKMLDKNGVFVLDYFNPTKIIHDIIPHQTVVQGGIRFDIQKTITPTQIFKKISFDTDNQHFTFTEQVRTYTFEQLTMMLNTANFEIKSVFGSYNLDAFDPDNSSRQIIIAHAQ